MLKKEKRRKEEKTCRKVVPCLVLKLVQMARMRYLNFPGQLAGLAERGTSIRGKLT